MEKVISIGNQDFASLIEEDSFYVDKTNFVKEWWESKDIVTLITRPRRFGKTLNMDMLNCFFSNDFAYRGDLFEKLSIWKEEKYRRLQGTYPVLFFSFADVKQTDYESAVKKIKKIIAKQYTKYRHLLEWDGLSSSEKQQFSSVDMDMDNVMAQSAIQDLCEYLSRYYGKNVIILLDEYDTPMQEAYLHGYWDEFTAFIRGLFNSTFKTNQYLYRAVMTGITRVSKESVFSDLNNLRVISTTSQGYSTCFGFTEEEVFAAMDSFGLSEQKENVKKWYDGFVFGSQKDIYNPWSVTSFLQEKSYKLYWAATSSNKLVSSLIQTGSAELKNFMEELLVGNEIVVTFDEQIVFNQLKDDENAVWSFLMASGYLKSEEIEYRGDEMEPWYHLKITNLETRAMFSRMFKGWFKSAAANYNGFVKALLAGNVKEMNLYMNDLALETFSSFDTGKNLSAKSQPERFYHGFVLGLLSELRDIYLLKSNRESGYGRYDVMLIPKKKDRVGIVMEFKVHDKSEEAALGETVLSALRQIEEKKYDEELLLNGISKQNIRHYGFAFEGKKVLIGNDAFCL